MYNLDSLVFLRFGLVNSTSMILQNVAWPHHPRCFYGQNVRSNSLFTAIQSTPTTTFQVFPKGWQVQNRSFGRRHSTARFLIFMLDKEKDNDIQEDSTVKHDLPSRKKTKRFDKELHLGGQLDASDQQFLDEFLSTERFASDEGPPIQFNESRSKLGTIKGAISLITGTSIGTGILALPASTAPAGFIPSTLSMVICWGFLVIEALLLAEVNVALLRQRGQSHSKNCESEVISLRTMAEQTLGKWGGILSTVSYIFLSYTIMVAYIAKSGEVLSILVNVPAPVARTFFTCTFGILILVGGTNFTDKLNQLLTACLMVGATPFLGGWSGVNHMDWDMVPQTIPVIIFSLVYHDLTPVICAYLGGDISRIRTSIIFGSMVPLGSFLIWDAVALGVSPNLGGEDPLDFLLRIGGSSGSYIVQLFSLFAVATSLIGTLLGFLEFFMEQLSSSAKISALLRGHLRIIPFFMIFSKVKQFSRLVNPFKGTISSSTYQTCFGRSFTLIVTRGSKMASVINKWWMNNNMRVASFALVIFPPLVISTTVTDAFFTATDIAGSYGMMTLYGIFPPAMAWAFTKSNDKSASGKSALFALPGGKFTLAGIGFCACGVVLDQALLDLGRIPFPSIVDNDLITEISNAFSFLY